MIENKYAIGDRVQIINTGGKHEGFTGTVTQMRIYNNKEIVYVVELDIINSEIVEFHALEEYLKPEEINSKESN